MSNGLHNTNHDSISFELENLLVNKLSNYQKILEHSCKIAPEQPLEFHLETLKRAFSYTVGEQL